MTVRVERASAVTIVTIDRPAARNAVDRPTAALLADAFRDFDADPSQSVAVLTGAHGTFCAGADLKAFGTDRANSVSTEGDGPMGPTRMLLSKPVIAAVEGYAVAGGLELALWCDLRVMARDAAFGVFCRRWGVPLIDGGTIRLPRLIGHSRALDLMLTGREVNAEESLAIGLANRVVDPGTALSAAIELAG
ncbi:MAG: crotonase/enoyl-CoA hydratase family protein, partial [Acidimicrobiia bacterium]